MPETPVQRPPLPEPLPVPVVDNHTHLDHEDPTEVGQLLAWAAQVGVPQAVQIGCSVPAAHRSLELTAQFPQLRAGVALHPNVAPRLAAEGELQAGFAQIAELARHESVCVVSETGMDRYRTDGQDEEAMAAQEESFRWHIDLAKELGKPMQIHNRNADGDVLRVLDDMGAPEQTVFHCFSSDEQMARECVRRGYYLSFSGNVTFKNAHSVREAARVTPLDRILVETDAPYLTATPYRGKPNASYLMVHTVRMLADIHDVSVQVACETLRATTEEIYGAW